MSETNSAQSPSRYLGQKQGRLSAFDSRFNPWWSEAGPRRFKSCPVRLA
jgi:hypothetical protein